MLKPMDRFEQAYQMLMHMTGKLSRQQKVDWPKHLLEIGTHLQFYKSSCHHWIKPALSYVQVPTDQAYPKTVYFPMMRGHGETSVC